MTHRTLGGFCVAELGPSQPWRRDIQDLRAPPWSAHSRLFPPAFSRVQGARGPARAFLRGPRVLFVGAEHLPKPPPPVVSSLGVRISIYEFGEGDFRPRGLFAQGPTCLPHRLHAACPDFISTTPPDPLWKSVFLLFQEPPPTRSAAGPGLTSAPLHSSVPPATVWSIVPSRSLTSFLWSKPLPTASKNTNP